MDQRTEKEKLEEFLGTAAPEKADKIELVDNGLGEIALLEFFKSPDIKVVVPAVARSPEMDQTIPAWSMPFTLKDLLRKYENFAHKFIYGDVDWKGGFYLFQARPAMIAKPTNGVAGFDSIIDTGWIIPYSPETKRCPVTLIGKVFVTEMRLQGISKLGKARAHHTTIIVQIDEGHSVKLNAEAELDAGYWSCVEAYDHVLGDFVLRHERITRDAYLVARALSASMLSYPTDASDVELSEHDKAKRYVEIVAMDNAAEIELIAGTEFDTYPLIHISKDEIPSFSPFVSARTLGVDEEDRLLPRICVTPYVINSLVAKGTLRGDYFERDKDETWPMMRVYGLNADWVFRPSGKLVADAPATDELWLLSYSESTQQYPAIQIAEFFPKEITYQHLGKHTQATISKIEWYVQVQPDKQIMWCKGCPLVGGYYHITEERTLVDEKPKTKFIKRVITSDMYVAGKELLVNIPKKEAPPSSRW